VIREQIEEAEATVAREVAEFDARYPPEAFVYEKPEPISAEAAGPQAGSEEQPKQAKPTAEPVSEQAPVPNPEADTKEPKDAPVEKDAQSSKEQPSEPIQPEAAPADVADAAHSKDDAHRTAHDDDGDEMLEDNEDTVIY
jgi:hypothetical protein